MRLIDVDALFEGKPPIKVILSGMLDSKDAARILNDAIKVYHDSLVNAPIIDAVPVVRCGVCKWYDSEFYICSKCGAGVERDFYCADGEVKQNDQPRRDRASAQHDRQNAGRVAKAL